MTDIRVGDTVELKKAGVVEAVYNNNNVVQIDNIGYDSRHFDSVSVTRRALPETTGSVIKVHNYYYMKQDSGRWVSTDSAISTFQSKDFAQADVEVVYEAT